MRRSWSQLPQEALVTERLESAEKPESSQENKLFFPTLRISGHQDTPAGLSCKIVISLRFGIIPGPLL